MDFLPSFSVIPRKTFLGLDKSKGHCFTLRKAITPQYIEYFMLNEKNLQTPIVFVTDEGEFFAVSACDVPHASRYEFKAGKSLPFDTHWGAEADVDWIEIDSAGSYEVVSSLRASEGERAFHLAHTTTHDETITFNQWVVPSESSLLHFDEFIGPRSTDQVRLIQVSTDQGRAWQTVFRDASSYSLLFGRPDDCASDFLKPISRPAP